MSNYTRGHYMQGQPYFGRAAPPQNMSDQQSGNPATVLQRQAGVRVTDPAIIRQMQMAHQAANTNVAQPPTQNAHNTVLNYPNMPPGGHPSQQHGGYPGQHQAQLVNNMPLVGPGGHPHAGINSHTERTTAYMNQALNKDGNIIKQITNQQSRAGLLQLENIEANDPIIFFRRNLPKLKSYLADIMTTAEILTIESHNEYNGNTVTELTSKYFDQKLKNGSLGTSQNQIKLTVQLENFYNLCDKLQMSLYKAKDQLATTVAILQHIPNLSATANNQAQTAGVLTGQTGPNGQRLPLQNSQPGANSTGNNSSISETKSKYQEFLETLRLQIDGANQIHEVFKTLSDNLTNKNYEPVKEEKTDDFSKEVIIRENNPDFTNLILDQKRRSDNATQEFERLKEDAYLVKKGELPSRKPRQDQQKMINLPQGDKRLEDHRITNDDDAMIIGDGPPSSLGGGGVALQSEATEKPNNLSNDQRVSYWQDQGVQRPGGSNVPNPNDNRQVKISMANPTNLKGGPAGQLAFSSQGDQQKQQTQPVLKQEAQPHGQNSEILQQQQMHADQRKNTKLERQEVHTNAISVEQHTANNQGPIQRGVGINRPQQMGMPQMQPSDQQAISSHNDSRSQPNGQRTGQHLGSQGSQGAGNYIDASQGQPAGNGLPANYQNYPVYRQQQAQGHPGQHNIITQNQGGGQQNVNQPSVNLSQQNHVRPTSNDSQQTQNVSKNSKVGNQGQGRLIHQPAGHGGQSQQSQPQNHGQQQNQMMNRNQMPSGQQINNTQGGPAGGPPPGNQNQAQLAQVQHRQGHSNANPGQISQPGQPGASLSSGGPSGPSQQEGGSIQLNAPTRAPAGPGSGVPADGTISGNQQQQVRNHQIYQAHQSGYPNPNIQQMTQEQYNRMQMQNNPGRQVYGQNYQIQSRFHQNEGRGGGQY